VIGLLAHGGWGGLAVEIAGGVAILVLGIAFWIGNRRDGSAEDK
jgi:hypothetical protein